MEYELEDVKPFYASERATGFAHPGIYLLGYTFDGTVSFRAGSRFGPDAIRDASYGQESYSPYLDKDTEDRNVFDLGNLPQYTSRGDILRNIYADLTKKADLSKHKIITLGGEHSISYAPIKRYLETYKDLVVLHLDAHTDLRDGYLEDDHSHASIIRRIWDHMTNKNQLIQYGIRSGLKEEFSFMKEKNTWAQSLDECVERIAAIDSKRPIYMTLDLDFFDPSALPGTGTPEAGGETFHGFIKILKVLNQKNLVGADIVELAPQLDSSGISSCLAAKVTREVILSLS